MGRTAEWRPELVELANDSVCLYMCYHPVLPTRSKVNDWEMKRSCTP